MSPSLLDRVPRARTALQVLGALALAVFFYLPVNRIVDISLDASNYASYTYFTARGFQYGTEVVPMTGPFGFITYGQTYNGELFWLRTVLELALKGVLAGLIVWFMSAAREHARWLRWGWLVALVVFTNTIEDGPLEWLAVLTGLRLLHPGRPASRRVILWSGILLGLLALTKGTQLSLSCAIVGLVSVAVVVARRDWKSAALLAGSFAGGLLAWWLVAGQNPLHLPAFVRGVLQLTSGYNNAMGIEEPDAIFRRGVLTALLLFVALLWAALRSRRHLGTIAGLALLAGYSFVKWKHGFVRADGHVFIFFQFAAVAAFAWYFWVRVTAPDAFGSRPVRVLGAAAVAAVFVSACLGAGEAAWARFKWQWEQVPIYGAERIRQLSRLPRVPAELDKLLERQRALYSLPQTTARIGNASLDLFGVDHGIVPLNGLHYRPRPMSGGPFNVYTPYLMRLNAAFMGDPARRPEYFLTKLSTIDNRLLAQDDSQTLLALIRDYEPVDLEQGWVLLKGNDRPRPIAPKKFATRSVTLGEKVPVPDAPPGQIVLASFEVVPTWLGRLRSFLYKPSLLFINLEGKNLTDKESRRLVPPMASLPFVMNPALEDTADLLRLYSADPGKQVHDFRLEAMRPQDIARIEVTFHTFPRPERAKTVDIDEMVNFVRFPLANVLPESIKPADARRSLLAHRPVQLLLPPAEMVWKLDGTERELLFDYGFDPHAYEVGTGNGVEFVVELRQPGLPPQPIYRRRFDPTHRPEDRGNFSARVVLPPFKNGTRLALRTDPGEFGDNAWDWPYVTRIQIKRGPYSETQFPGFSRVPDTVDADFTSLLDTDYGRVILLHAPGNLTFNLRGTERRLHLQFGFVPGAYTGEGSTDGAVYLVELARPNQPREVLFQRHLRPRSEGGDQGLQTAEIALPPLGVADRLILRTDPGPDRNNAWDWTILARVTLQ